MKNLSYKNFLPQFTFKKLFVIDFQVLSFFGFWPENLISLKSAVLFVSSFAFEFFPEVFFIYEFSNNIQKIFMCLHEITTVIIYFFKMTLLFSKRNKIVKLVDDLRVKWNESERFKF